MTLCINSLQSDTQVFVFCICCHNYYSVLWISHKNYYRTCYNYVSSKSDSQQPNQPKEQKNMKRIEQLMHCVDIPELHPMQEKLNNLPSILRATTPCCGVLLEISTIASSDGDQKIAMQ